MRQAVVPHYPDSLFRLTWCLLQISVRGAESGEESFRSRKVKGLTGERFSNPWAVEKPSFSAVLPFPFIPHPFRCRVEPSLTLFPPKG